MNEKVELGGKVYSNTELALELVKKLQFHGLIQEASANQNGNGELNHIMINQH